MNKLNSFILLLLACFVPQTAMAADYYGIKVGGVNVTSDNYSNITGSNIGIYKSGLPSYVRYNSSTKTLTVCNIRIERTGSNNRAILNESCDGLTIHFVGRSLLKAADSSPVRLNANTTITSQLLEGSDNHVVIQGGDEDALTVGSGATLTFLSTKDCPLTLYATNSDGLTGNTGNEQVSIGNSSVTIRGTMGVTSLAKLTVKSSYVNINGAVSGLSSFSMNSDMMCTSGATYMSALGTFLDKSTSTRATAIRLETFTKINATNFPDDAFRSYVTSTHDANSDGVLSYSEALGVTSINISGIGLSDLTGIGRFTNLQTLDCSNNPLQTLRLSFCPTVVTLNCSSCQLTSLSLAQATLLQNLDCSKNSLTLITFSSTPAIRYIDMRNNRIDGDMSATLRSLPSRPSTDRGEIYINGGVNTMPDNICDSWTASSISYIGWDWHLAPCEENTGAQLLNVKIGDEEVTSFNRTYLATLSGVKKNTADGYIQYNPMTQTLSLSGVDIIAPQGECGISFHNMGRPCNIQFGSDPVNIITVNEDGIASDFETNVTVNGKVKIESGKTAIDIYKGSIQGPGTLDCKGEVNGIIFSYGLVISGNPTITAEGTTRFGIMGNTEIHGENTIVSMKGTQGALKASKLILADGLFIGYPENAYLKDYANGIVDASGQTIKDEWVVVSSKDAQTIYDGIESLTPDPSPRRGENWFKHGSTTVNLAGQKVGTGYKGIVVRDGRKILVK